MPSKIQLDENLWFLYICMKNSDFKTIDFAAVGEATNLNSPAARMRYTRLRKSIEDGTLVGTHGKPFQGAGEKIAAAKKKRKRAPNSDQVTEDEESGPICTRTGGGNMKSPGSNHSAEESNALGTNDEDDMPRPKKRAKAMPKNHLSRTGDTDKWVHLETSMPSRSHGGGKHETSTGSVGQ